jgi:hypothetical protein
VKSSLDFPQLSQANEETLPHVRSIPLCFMPLRVPSCLISASCNAAECDLLKVSLLIAGMNTSWYVSMRDVYAPISNLTLDLRDKEYTDFAST